MVKLKKITIMILTDGWMDDLGLAKRSLVYSHK